MPFIPTFFILVLKKKTIAFDLERCYDGGAEVKEFLSSFPKDGVLWLLAPVTEISDKRVFHSFFRLSLSVLRWYISQLFAETLRFFPSLLGGNFLSIRVQPSTQIVDRVSHDKSYPRNVGNWSLQSEAWFHSSPGRRGVPDTSVKLAELGYIRQPPLFDCEVCTPRGVPFPCKKPKVYPNITLYQVQNIDVDVGVDDIDPRTVMKPEFIRDDFFLDGGMYADATTSNRQEEEESADSETRYQTWRTRIEASEKLEQRASEELEKVRKIVRDLESDSKVCTGQVLYAKELLDKMCLDACSHTVEPLPFKTKGLLDLELFPSGNRYYDEKK